ncbi:MAG TPA: DUF4159 domain-containing protein [Gemmatimonadales bacterium]|jgi:hypothetical protein
MRVIYLVAGLLAVVAIPSPAEAQRFGRGEGFPDDGNFEQFNVPYDGRFVFVRLRYDPLSSGFRRRNLWWDHDYPRAERHLTTILEELTTVVPRRDGSNILAADDPELFKYPVAYLSEPGHWTMSESEMVNLRAYVLKGGFLIFDDFEGGDWYNFAEQVRRLLPEHQIVRLDPSHPIFHSFYDIDTFEGIRHPYSGRPSQFHGVFEDNDPTKRLLMIINYDADIGESWEWSDTGFIPIDLTNQAYKLGINYIVYAMTH